MIKVNKELDNFVYNASHNLRSPLTSLLGLISLAKIEKPKEDLLENYLDMMEVSVKKLDATIKTILDYSRNSREVISRDKIDLEALAHRCFGELEYLMGQDKIEEIISIKGGIFFFSDEKRLSVLLHNLISNSIKYRDLTKTNQFIKLSATICESMVTICFEDNGIGIEENLLPKVYDMFYRATDRSNGAGLGLYIAKEIVLALNGKLSIQSIINQGTTLTISIPNLRGTDL